MSEAVISEPFYSLAASLKEGGFKAHGEHIELILHGVWTTSSELIAELGQAVLKVRKECKPLNSKQKLLIRQCLREVRKAFPGFGFFSWFPFH
jgi:hypothetical protein